MASSSNQEQQPPASPVRALASPPIHDRDLPPNPPVQLAQSDSEWASQNQTSDPTSSLPTNPTTVLSTSHDKSAPNSLYDTVPPPDGKFRIPSVSAHDHDRNGHGPRRIPSVARPRAVLGLDPSIHPSPRLQSGLEWIVPTTMSEKRRERTAGERLEPTIVVARRERDQYATRGKQYGLGLNIAIGLQVVVGALTTGVAAATTGRATSIGVSILGGMSTILASFLAKSRGSGEPEFSVLRARELDTFIREAEAWVMDHGHSIGSEWDERINSFRERFEQIIKTEGEDSSSGTGFTNQSGGSQPNAIPPHAQSQQWQGNPRANEKV